MISRSPKRSCGCAGLGAAGPAQQGPDAGRQLLRRERLGEVVVGAASSPATTSWVSSRAVTITIGTSLVRRIERHSSKPSMPGQHDVDQHDVGRLAVERLERVLAAAGLLDGPALVLERQLHGGADALVVLDGQDAGSHSLNGAA